MPREFEVTETIELAATPEQVWEAIATGPGVDSWFMGRNEIEAGVGGRTSCEVAGHPQSGTVTAWEPGRRYATRSDEGPGGEFMAMEFLIEGRDRGTTVLRFVHSGFLGEDWEAEYEAMSVGDRMYVRKLAVYLANFPGHTSSHNMFLIGPRNPDLDGVWSRFMAAFDLTSTAEGTPATLTVPGLPAVTGVVAFSTEPWFLGVRTDDGIFMLVHGYRDVTVAEYHHFGETLDVEAFEGAWQRWLDGLS